MISGIPNLVYELPHELPNNLKLRILGNYEILEKIQMLVETQPTRVASGVAKRLKTYYPRKFANIRNVSNVDGDAG